jgi:myo-inositol-1(or 4)-monophosphatase
MADGRMTAFVDDMEDGAVHFAAAVALCRAAGCTVLDLEGAEWSAGAKSILAAADRATALDLLRMWRDITR